MKTKLAAYAVFSVAAFLLYKQWTRKGNASFGPLTPVDPALANPYGDPNAETHPPNDVGAPGSNAYGDKSLTGLTEDEEWDALNRLRQTAPTATVFFNPSIPGVATVFLAPSMTDGPARLPGLAAVPEGAAY